MEIHYVRFQNPVSIGGDFGSIQSWTKDKHADKIAIEEKGSFLILTLWNGDRRRVPMRNVDYISESPREAK